MMMTQPTPSDLQAIFEQAARAHTALGDHPEVQAFVGDMAEFLRRVLPVMSELQSSLALTAEKLPTASKQLSKVTEANELASTEILDIVERIMDRAQKLAQKVGDGTAGASPAIDHLAALIARMPRQEGAADVQTAWADVLRTHVLVPRDPAAASILQEIQNDCTSIMIALQVQDITAQQIAGVNSLMQSVDEGLHALVRHVHGESCGTKGDAFQHKHLDIVHDPLAEYTGAEERQELADRIIASQRQGNAPAQ